MGTTDDALRSQTGVRIGFVLAIEGFDYLITDQIDTAPVVTAWAGSGWTKAIPGLKVRGRIREAIVPWADTLEVPTLTFEIMPDANDTFGIAVWKTKPGFRTRLTELFAAAPDGSGTMIVKDTAALGGSGQVYIGNRNVAYASKTSTTLGIAAGGAKQFGVFGAGSGNHYSVTHRMPAGYNWDAAPSPRVQDVPPTWIGRRVGLYLHRIVGERWDTRAQAHLEFAGKITALSESGPHTVLGCTDLRADIRDAQLLKGQWRGYLKPGIRLMAGDALFGIDLGYNTFDGTVLRGTSDGLEVVASGATGTDQINEGYYELGDFLARLNTWLANSEYLASKWSIGTSELQEGRRTIVRTFWPGSYVGIGVKLLSTSRLVLEFLGWSGEDITPSVGEFTSSAGGIRQSSVAVSREISSRDAIEGAVAEIVSSGPPYQTKPLQARGRTMGTSFGGGRIDLESSDGEWVPHLDFLPEPFASYPAVDEDWSFVAIDNLLFFAHRLSATQLELSASVDFVGFASSDEEGSIGRTVDDGTDRMEVRQVVVLSDSFAELMPRLFASTDGRGVNHADYDEFVDGMGCPGIPWELLGEPFLESARTVDQAISTESMMIAIDRPTRFVDLLMPELQLRFAWLVFKDGTYRFVSPPLPNAMTAEHVLTEDNKAGPPGDLASLESSTSITTEFLRNVIKVEFNRTVGGKYRDLIVVRDESSISDYGITQAVTISAPSSYADAARTGAAVEDLTASLVERTLPMFGRPMKLVRRTIAPTLYHMAPGDSASLTDELVRDLVTGRRGLVGRGCTCLAVTRDYGHEGGTLFGEVELLLSDEDRTFPMAPCAQVDATYSVAPFASGYDPAGRLKLLAHQHSRSTDAVDLAGFAVGDKVRILEIDPANPASITAWDREISVIDTATSIVTLATTLSSPAFNAALRYRMVPQRYSEVVPAQRVHSYLAQSANGLIQGLAQPNLYADDVDDRRGFTRAAATTLPRMFANEVHGEGRPLHPGLVHDHYVMLNNLVSYKTAPHMPMSWTTIDTSDSFYVCRVTGHTLFQCVAIFPFFLGGHFYKRSRRVLRVLPIITIVGAAKTVTCRVTSSERPPRGPVTKLGWSGARKSITFSRTGSATVAEQSLPIVRSQTPLCTWITVEIMTSDGSTVDGWAYWKGFERFYLGPVIV